MIVLAALAALAWFLVKRHRKRGRFAVSPIDTGYRSAFRVPGGFKGHRGM